MVRQTAIWLSLSIIGAILGRLGGKKGFNTKFRDIGTSLCICLILGLCSAKLPLKQWLWLIPTFGLQWAALTSYKYFLPKPKDYFWWHYSLHGFMAALAAITFAWTSGHWFWFWVRVVICAGWCSLVYPLHKLSDDLHEGLRYFGVCLSTRLLCLI